MIKHFFVSLKIKFSFKKKTRCKHSVKTIVSNFIQKQISFKTDIV